MENVVSLYVSVPVASFRVPRAREYFETLPCPPPSTVYGMLLSLVGETNRHAHEGAELAIAMLSKPEYSIVLRTLWRVKSRKHGPGLGENKRPDFQELLTNVKLIIWVRKGEMEDAALSLAERIQIALGEPQVITRFGGLSLGESTHLVNDVRLLHQMDGTSCQLLKRDPEGDLALPVWPDHVGSSGTRWDQYRLVNASIADELPDHAWTPILRKDNL